MPDTSGKSENPYAFNFCLIRVGLICILYAMKTFNKRSENVKDEMKSLYMGLYGDEHAYEYFICMLKSMYEKRSSSLKQLDKKRLEKPDWYKSRHILGMQMYTDCFSENLNGIRSHLDYLEETGVNYIHIMPILKSPKGKSDGGYAVADYRGIEPKFGTMNDLKSLTTECHKRDMSVCLDFVMNHTSDEHEWAVRAKAGEEEYQQRYFFYNNWNIPDEYEKTLPEVFPTTAPGNFIWCGQAGKVVMSSFYPYQWDLNYHNPTVFNDMTENMLYLCNQGIDIIRLDAVPYIWKEMHTNCRNLPQVHTLVRLLNLATYVVCPGVLLLGEVVMEPDKVVPYFGSVERPECHMLYNVTTMASTWHTVATKDTRLLKNQLDTVFSLPKQYTFLNYLRCHDDIGWGLDYDFLKNFGMEEIAHKRYLNDYFQGKVFGSEARGELYNDDPALGDARLCGTAASLCGMESGKEECERLDIMLHAFLFTQSGISIIYSGDEVAQLNDYSYHNDPLKKDDSRYIHRGKMDWKAADERNNRKTRSGRIYTSIQRLLDIRKNHKCFDFDADVWTMETGDISILGIGRYKDGEKLLAYFNFGNENKEVCLNEIINSAKELFSNRNIEQSTYVVPGHSFAWILY